MYRLLLFILLALPGSLAAQDLPEPGEGAYVWETLGMQEVETADLAFEQTGTLLSFENELSRYERSTETWTTIDTPNPVGSVGAILPLGADTLVAGRLLSRSLDGGQTWQYPCLDADNNITCERLSIDGSQAIYEIPRGPHAGRLLAGGSLYSDDRGASWQNADLSATGENDFWSFAMHDFAALPSGRVVAAGEWGVGVSPDGGESWTTVQPFAAYGFNGYGIEAFATPGSVQAHDAGGPAPSCGLTDPAQCEGAVWLGTSTEAVGVRSYWTNDGGRSWTEGSPLPQVYDGPGWGLVAYLGELDRAGTTTDGSGGAGRGLAVLGRGFIFATVDGGVTWQAVARVPLAPNDDGHRVTSAEVGPDGRLYVAWLTDSPVFVTQEAAAVGLDAVVVSDEASPSPDIGVTVSPNPSWAGTVTVGGALPSPSADVRAEVYDAVGRRVAVLYEGAAGAELSLSVDTSRWAPGVYTVRVTSSGAVTAETLTVVR